MPDTHTQRLPDGTIIRTHVVRGKKRRTSAKAGGAPCDHHGCLLRKGHSGPHKKSFRGGKK